MKLFISIFKAEHYKTKGNIAVLLFLLCPFIPTAYIYVGKFIEAYKATKAGEFSEYSGNPWIIIAKGLLILYLFYPILVSILAYSLCDMEYRNKNFKRLFTLPYPIHTIFASKILFLIEVVLLSSLIAYVSFVFGGFALSYIFPQFSFQNYDIRLACLIFHIRLFISLLSVLLIQYSISLIFKNFVVPVGFGCFMFVFSLLSMRSEKNYLNPFAAVYNSLNEFISFQAVSFNKYDYACLVYIFVFLFINYFLFKRQRIN